MEIKMFIFGYYLLQIWERDKLGANARGKREFRQLVTEMGGGRVNRGIDR